MRGGVWTAGILGAITWALFPGVSVASDPPPNPRSLPSLVTRWTWPTPEAQWLVIDGGVAYVQTASRVAALDPATGSVLWDQALGLSGDDSYSHARLLPLEHVVVVAGRKTLFVLDRASGRVQRSLALEGTIIGMAGPPPVVSVYDDARGHVDIVAIDTDSGEVRARRDVGRNTPPLEVRDGVLVTRLNRADGDVSVGLRASDLSELWRLDPRAYGRLDVIDGRIYTRAGKDRYVPVDPTTGRTGAPVAVIEASALTAMRTGALTAIGARYLARRDSRVLGHVGARGTAYWNVRLLDRLFDFAEIRVHSLRRESRESFARLLEADLGKPVRVTESWEDCLGGADIMVEASRLERPEPRLETRWVEPGCLVIPYGTVSAVELTLTDVMDKIVVDDWGQARAGRFGALRAHVDTGRLSETNLHAELCQIVVGERSGRESDDERILFWHRGLSLSDIALGHALLEKARTMGIGRTLDLA